MILGWSPYQAGSRHQPKKYLLGFTVEKAMGRRRGNIVRDPVPELLLGDPVAFQVVVARLTYERCYRVVTVTFTPDEMDPQAFNAGDPVLRRRAASIIEVLSETFHAGLPPEARLPMIAGTHNHAGQLEINLAMPRGVILPTGKIRSFNPHPPTRGSQNDLDAACDLLIGVFSLADPRGPEHRARLRQGGSRHSSPRWPGRGSPPRRTDRSLWLLDTLKTEAKGCETIDDLLLTALRPMAEVGFEVLNRTPTTLRLGPPGSAAREGLTLRGSLVAGPMDPEAIQTHAAVLKDAPDRLSKAWHRRAAYNQRTFGLDPVQEPPWARIL